MACLNSIDCRILEILVWNLGFTSHFSFRGRLVDGGVTCRSVEWRLVGGLVVGGLSGLVDQPEEVLYSFSLMDGGSL